MRAFAVAAAISVAPTAHAYRTASDLPDFPDDHVVRWSTLPIELELVERMPDGLDLDEARDAIEGALQTWSSVPCASVALTLRDSSTASALPGDGHNTIE